MAHLRNIFAMAFVAFVALQTSANAANCTDDEQSTVDNVYANLANSTACGDLVADSDVTSLDYCQNSDCLSVLSDALDQLPDCTGEDEIDRKTGLQSVIAYCTDTNEVLDQSASASGSSTGSGSVVSGASTGVMTMGAVVAQLSVALYFVGFLCFHDVDLGSGCCHFRLLAVRGADDPVYVNAPCTATDCVNVVEGVANDLPDCTFNGLNHKIQVQNALTACIGGEIEDAGSLTAATDAPTATDSSTVSPSTSSASSSALTPEATTIAMDAYCNTSEIINLWNLYVATATSEECASDSVVNGGNIEIIAQCNTNCMEAIRGLADELPDCFYDYEYINKKQYVLDQLDGCDGSATTINISLLPDNAVDYSSSSGFGSAAGFSSSSGSNALMAGDSASGSEQLNSENNPSDNTLGSSSGKSGSNASPPRGGKVLSWVSLMAVVVAAFMS
ncbi:hypothetical protein GQ600_20416 [Phytophthora cactorum]|nr:hypothetical protein GQ600_20416 [Phytophthora cactorum]